MPCRLASAGLDIGLVRAESDPGVERARINEKGVLSRRTADINRHGV